jgi:hypothetical protein
VRLKREKRPITVDGEAYRWILSPNDGFLTLVVYSQNRLGQRLIAHLSYEEKWVEDASGVRRSAGHRIVTPRLVRKIILDARLRGWDPAATKPPEFRITVED